MATLITGAAGLIGSHLAEALVKDGEEVLATYLSPTVDITSIHPSVHLVTLDVLDRTSVFDLISIRRPKVVHHLAAQSLPTVSWQDPWTTLNVNILGTVNLFEAIRAVRREDATYDPMVVVACSSAAYGASMVPERVPVTEEAPLLPLHPYGVSKVAQDLLAFQYFVNDGIRSVRARIFNCTGPRKQNDAVSDFARAVMRCINTGEQILVGNLETQRALIDVRDMVSALRTLSHKGHAGTAYNICSEKAVFMKDVLQSFFHIIGRELPYTVDPRLLRPSDEPIILGSSARLREHTGWSPRIPLEQTIRDVLDFERKRWDGTR